jgi:ketosteroid isomerase-like protein
MFRPRLLTLTFALTAATALATIQPDDPARGIRATLDAQVSAWNHGDIDGFMEGYWKSDDLTFSAGGRTIRGWKATRVRYQTRYSDRSKMGKLDFSDLEIRPLCDGAALVLGRWRLHTAAGNPGGNFSLVFTRQAGRWLIVHDHTSGDEPAASQSAASRSKSDQG